MKKLAMLSLLIFNVATVSAQEGSRALDFTLQDIEGRVFKSADFIGKHPMLIDFWATWCNPCKVELPHLDAIYKKYEKQGLIFLAISEDSPRSISKVKPYVKSKNFAATILLDPDGQVLKKFFGEGTLPYTILINKEGDIVRTFTGYVPGQESDIEKMVAEMLSKTAEPSPENQSR